MFSDLFDSPWKVLIIAAVVLVLFGAKKMPDAARSLGKSMRILKTEMSSLHDDDKPDAADGQAPQQAPAAPPQITAPGPAMSAQATEPARENQPT